MKKTNQIKINGKKSILNFLETKSQILRKYIEGSDNDFILYLKYLNHSDLPTFGKATKINSHDDNLLYYLKTDEMLRIESSSEKNFETAHQSNISLPKSFWLDLGMKDPRETVRNYSYSKRINDHADVFLVNEGLNYFSDFYTKQIFNKLDKRIKNSRKREWLSNDLIISNPESEFLELELTQAVHGIGTSEDREFHKLRHHMFKNDILIIIIEKTDIKNKLFILPVKNPIFYSLIGEYNASWLKYKFKEENRLISETRIDQIEIIESYDRRYQDKWRNLLAEEMMNYSTSDYEVFCPFTLINTRFDELGTLFRASHIKSFKDSDENEKYDLNNGLLLVANADALFDKHFITVNENKELEFSFLIESDHLLKSRLLLNNSIFKDVLNEKRMEYLSYHRQIFQQKETERKKSNNNYLIV